MGGFSAWHKAERKMAVTKVGRILVFGQGLSGLMIARSGARFCRSSTGLCGACEVATSQVEGFPPALYTFRLFITDPIKPDR